MQAIFGTITLTAYTCASSLRHEIYRVRRDCEGGPNAKRNSSWFYFGVAGGSANQIITMASDAHAVE